MAKPTVTLINFDALKGKLSALSNIQQRRALKVGLENVGAFVAGQARLNIRNLNMVQTGALMNSISVKVSGLEVTVFSPLKYAAIREYGGTIYPVKAKYLAIPIGNAAKNVGSPRNWPGNLSYVPVAGPGSGGGYLIDDGGIPRYRLVRSVTQKGKPYLGPVIPEHMSEIQQVFEVAVMDAIQESIG